MLLQGHFVINANVAVYTPYLQTSSAVSRETVSSALDVMSLLTVNDDSSSRRFLFFRENLADGGGLFRGEVHHANFDGNAVMSILIFFPPRLFFISLSRKCSEQTFVSFPYSQPRTIPQPHKFTVK